jgi:molybdopterin-guanine dinucleotide biosynthesis protein A
MRRAKALLPWAGKTMVAHLVATLRGVVDEIVVVSSADLELPRLDATVVIDKEPFLGPLAGLAAGLAAIESDCAFATATDTPWLRSELVSALLREGPTVAVESEGHVQPLAAVYPREAAATAAALLADGRRRPLALLEAHGYRSRAAECLPGGDSLKSLNTPEEYLEALRASEPRASARVEFLGRCRVATGAREREVAVGTLSEVLRRAAPELPLCDGVAVAKHFLVSLESRRFVRDAALPVGAGERVVVMDASVGG